MCRCLLRGGGGDASGNLGPSLHTGPVSVRAGQLPSNQTSTHREWNSCNMDDVMKTYEPKIRCWETQCISFCAGVKSWISCFPDANILRTFIQKHLYVHFRKWTLSLPSGVRGAGVGGIAAHLWTEARQFSWPQCSAPWQCSPRWDLVFPHPPTWTFSSLICPALVSFICCSFHLQAK